MAAPARAETLRLATWDAALSRKGPGLLLQGIAAGDDPQIAAAIRVITRLDADVLLLTGFDHDLMGVAAAEFAAALAAAGMDYPHRFAPPPNTGLPTGRDLDRNGRLGEARDAQGYGRFPGQGGMLLLSRLPFGEARDLSALLWADMPGNHIPADDPAPDIQRLSTTVHWLVPLVLPGAGQITIGAWAATPPVFDGPEDRNGRRAGDEATLWARLMDGDLPGHPPPAAPVLMGLSNLDPADGEGPRGAMAALLAHPALQDPAPRGDHGRVEPGHQGNPALDTADFGAGIGGLRVDYILPAASLRVDGAGILWPTPSDPLLADLTAASPHFPVWVDLAMPKPQSP